MTCLGVIGISSLLLAAPFERLGYLNAAKFRFLFPNADIRALDRIHSVRLNPLRRPNSWPDRIPFGVGINQDENRAYFLYYRSIFSKNIFEIDPGRFKQLRDICANGQGHIIVLDSGNDSVYLYQLSDDLRQAIPKGWVHVVSPLRCDIDQQGNFYVLGNTGDLHRFQVENGTLKPTDVTWNDGRQLLNGQKIIDFTISPYGEVYVLTLDTLYHCTHTGRKLRSLRLPHAYRSIGSSVYSDLFLLRSDGHSIDKYSRELTYLASLDLTQHFSEAGRDVTIYGPYGYLAVSAGSQGGYWGFKAAISDIRVVPVDTWDGSQQYEISYTLAFASTIRIDAFKGIQQIPIVADSTRFSGRHQLIWNGKDQDGKHLDGEVKIVIYAKGLYSLPEEIKGMTTLTLPKAP